MKWALLISLRSIKQDFWRILTFAAFSFSLIRCLTESSAKLVLDVEGTGGKSETEKNGDVFKLSIFWKKHMENKTIYTGVSYSNRKNLNEKMWMNETFFWNPVLTKYNLNAFKLQQIYFSLYTMNRCKKHFGTLLVDHHLEKKYTSRQTSLLLILLRIIKRFGRMPIFPNYTIYCLHLQKRNIHCICKLSKEWTRCKVQTPYFTVIISICLSLMPSKDLLMILMVQ